MSNNTDDDLTKPTTINPRGGIGLLDPLSVTGRTSDAAAVNLLLSKSTGLELSPVFIKLLTFGQLL